LILNLTFGILNDLILSEKNILNELKVS